MTLVFQVAAGLFLGVFAIFWIPILCYAVFSLAAIVVEGWAYAFTKECWKPPGGKPLYTLAEFESVFGVAMGPASDGKVWVQLANSEGISVREVLSSDDFAVGDMLAIDDFGNLRPARRKS